MFLGEFRHSLDAKGRIILPARFRGDLEAGLTIARGFDGCLWVLPRDAWQSYAQRVIQRTSFADPRARSLARYLFSGATEDRPDRQGRVSVPENLRRHASLELNGDVVVIGVGDRIEIWDPERWEAQHAQAEAHLQGDIAGLQG